MKSYSNVLRLLVINAATTSDELRHKERILTLFLLANYPKVGLEGFLHNSMSCYNMSSRFSTLLEKTVTVFIFLNLLLALVEGDKQGKLLYPYDRLEEFK